MGSVQEGACEPTVGAGRPGSIVAVLASRRDGGLEVETGSEKKIRGGVVHMPVTPTYPGVYIEEIPSIRGSMGGSIP